MELCYQYGSAVSQVSHYLQLYFAKRASGALQAAVAPLRGTAMASIPKLDPTPVMALSRLRTRGVHRVLPSRQVYPRFGVIQRCRVVEHDVREM